ncbi:MAG: agmatinase family protein [Deltaproteobacteria bacterium]
MPFDPNSAASPDSGVFGLSCDPADSKVVLLPVPFEATTSYGGGTSHGPSAILDASRQVDLFDIDTGKPYEAGIAWLEARPEIAHWNAEAMKRARPIIEAAGQIDGRSDLEDALGQVEALCQRTHELVRVEAASWIGKGKIVGTVGGDHSTAFGAIAAAAAANPGMGILHLDAHADLRVAFEGFAWSHASIMENVVRRLPAVGKLVQVGIRDLCEAEQELIDRSGGRIATFHDSRIAEEQLSGTPFARVAARIAAELPARVYLSFDIDGLDPTLCPHTGTPVPGGLSFREVNLLLGAVVRMGKRIVGFDLTEVAPGPEGDEWDANVGARLLYKMIGWTLRSQSISNE